MNNMHTGMLYNTFVCFVVGVGALIVFWQLRKVKKRKKKRGYSEGIDYFLLLYGLLWIFVGVRILFAWLGRPDLDMFVWRWFSGPMTYIHLVPLSYYFTHLFFKKRRLVIGFDIVIALIAIVVLFTFFRYGSTAGEMTYWGTDPTPNDLTNKLFTYLQFLPVLLCVVADLIRRLRNWRRTGSPTERQLFGINLGLLIYAFAGIFDGLGLAQNWTLLLVRIGIMVSALVIYLSATSVQEEGRGDRYVI